MSSISLLSILLGVTLLPMNLQASATSDVPSSVVMPMLDVCPPYNSSGNLMDHDGADICDEDDQCSSSTKCCCTELGRQCVSPIQVKLGRCPPSQAACPHMSSQPTCQTDDDCPDSQRCCDICGKTCWNPEPDPDGLCPVPEIILRNPYCSTVKCASDSECPSDTKCCLHSKGQKCLKIPSSNGHSPALNAEDVCPSVKDQYCQSPPDAECDNDSQCPTSQKCCCSNCGWKCVLPVKVKSGRCQTPDPRCRGMEFEPRCQSDIDCPKTQKCCDLCGKICSDPLPEPPGVCPMSEIRDVDHLQCSSVMCGSNEDCAPQRRCCLTGESQKCVKPQPVVLNVCPSFSPQICTMARHIINKCQNDSGCESPMKCCCSNCGWTCLTPVQVKPGRCPPIKPRYMDTEPKLTCESDDNCPRDEKCCGKSCWAPDPEPFGSCPVIQTNMVKPHCSTVQCSRDPDCPADEKCCLSDDSQKCVKPYPVVQSVCPQFNPGSCPPGRMKDDECSIDVQCPRKEKCCCTACGRKCVTPAHVKPGRCPNIPYQCAPLPPSCETDTDCPREEKCCDICGFTCHAPQPEPLGVCPVSPIKEKMLDCPSVSCTSDSDCDEKKKCCFSADTKECMLPIEEFSSSDLLRVCPSSDNSACLPNVSYPNECQEDLECSPSQKCCCSGCSLKCMSPEEVKAGMCPSQAPNLLDVLKATKCLLDSNCPGDMKCCPSLGFRCWKPIKELPGTCMALSGPRIASCSFVTCTRNDDCPLLTKCCPTTIGQTCTFVT